jgi:RNA polymerase sigma-70 factor (ECF subfamily)
VSLGHVRRTKAWTFQSSRARPERAAEGDERGASLFDHYHPRLYRYALAKLGSHAVADEVAAEVFAPAPRDLDRFRWRGGGFEAWIGFLRAGERR